MSSGTIYEALTQFIDEHVDLIARRKKGQTEQLRIQFETQTGQHVSAHMFGEFLTWYRRTHDIVMINDPNSWYAQKKRSASAD
jgi:hypothetical protein